MEFSLKISYFKDFRLKDTIRRLICLRNLIIKLITSLNFVLILTSPVLYFIYFSSYTRPSGL